MAKTIVSRRSPLFWQTQPGGIPTIGDLSERFGNIFIVDENGANPSDTDGHGIHPDSPFNTIDYAVGKCTANQGDLIEVGEGHTETLTAKIAADIAGVTIRGKGEGNTRPAITVGAVIDGIDVTVDDVVIENFYFPTPTALATALVNIAAARVVVQHCVLELGANVRDAITLTAAAERFTFRNNIVIVTADGPDSLLKFEGVVDLFVAEGNIIICSDGTNAFDVGVFDFNSLAVTNPVIRHNAFLGADVASTVVANGGSVVGAAYGPNVYAGSATSADNVAEDQEIIDALYGSAGITTWPAAAAPANGVSLAEAVRYIVETLIGTLVNTGGTATLGGILGDLANDSLVARLNDIGSDVDAATTDSIQGKLGTDTELADRSLYDQLNGAGPAAAAAAAAPANDVSLYAVASAIYNLSAPVIATGEADIDIDQADYTNYQNLIDIAPAAGAPLEDAEIVFDLDKAVTGFAAQHAAQTIQFAVARKVDGTNWRIEAGGEAGGESTALSGTLSALRAIRLKLGHVGITEDVRVYVKLSAENAVDVELPYALSYKALAAPTVTPVAAV